MTCEQLSWNILRWCRRGYLAAGLAVQAASIYFLAAACVTSSDCIPHNEWTRVCNSHAIGGARGVLLFFDHLSYVDPSAPKHHSLVYRLGIVMATLVVDWGIGYGIRADTVAEGDNAWVVRKLSGFLQCHGTIFLMYYVCLNPFFIMQPMAKAAPPSPMLWILQGAADGCDTLLQFARKRYDKLTRAWATSLAVVIMAVMGWICIPGTTKAPHHPYTELVYDFEPSEIPGLDRLWLEFEKSCSTPSDQDIERWVASAGTEWEYHYSACGRVDAGSFAAAYLRSDLDRPEMLFDMVFGKTAPRKWGHIGGKLAWRSAVNGWPVPARLMSNATEARILIELNEFLETGNQTEWQAKGSFYYPAATHSPAGLPISGGWREWHTNQGTSGWRMYLVHNAVEHQSSFSYIDYRTGEMHTNIEKKKLVRLFKIPDSNDFELFWNATVLWHCIKSSCGRWSFGLHLSESLAKKIVESTGKRFLAT